MSDDLTPDEREDFRFYFREPNPDNHDEVAADSYRLEGWMAHRGYAAVEELEQRVAVAEQRHVERMAPLVEALADAHHKIGLLEGERDAASWPGVVDGWREKAAAAEQRAVLAEQRFADIQKPVDERVSEYVPLSVRYGDRRKKLGWWWSGRRLALALRIAPWLTGTAPAPLSPVVGETEEQTR